jgi:TolB protein
MRARWAGRMLAIGASAALATTGMAAPAAAAPTTTRISSDLAGAPAAGHSDQPTVSANGRFVIYHSRATTLVAGDVNGQPDIFLFDRRTGRTELVSVSSAGTQGDGESYGASRVTPSGRHVVFVSAATNLVAGDTNGVPDVFVRDRRAGTTRLVSVAAGGTAADAHSEAPHISADGRFVAFSSAASNLVPGDTNGTRDVFVRDLASGQTRRVSVARDGRAGNGDSDAAGISADGRYVGFVSTATNLGPRVTTESNAYVKDLRTGTVTLVSVAPDGVRFEDGATEMSLSANGRRVAFNATPTTASGMTQTYARDLDQRRTTLVSVNVNGEASSGTSSHGSISPNGRYVAFVSGAHDLPAGFQFFNNVFVRDLRTATTFQASLTTAGLSPNTWLGIGGIGNTGVTFATAASHVTPDGADVTTSQVYLRTF